MTSAHLLPPENDYTGFASEEPHHDSAADTLLGFWIYVLSDCILFATLFATFAVLSGSFAGAITPADLFSLEFVAASTALLLFSSFTFGMAMLAARKQNRQQLFVWLGATFVLGSVFLGMELYEFSHFSAEGAGPTTSAYWSAFYALVGTHGLHVFIGLLWMIILVVHILKDGINGVNFVRLSCLSLFWHFLDIIWICVFSLVYLVGVL